MSYTYKETKNQYKALNTTFNSLLGKREEISYFISQQKYKRIVLTGCGSSYMISKSGELILANRMDIDTQSLPAGDILLNFENYENIINDSLLLVLSRSGSTSEILKSIDIVKSKYNCKILSVICKENSELGKISDYSILIPWAFDESVCQTRTVSNMYLAILMIAGIMSGDDNLITDLEIMINVGESYLAKYEDDFKRIADFDFTDTVILADGEARGIAEEGALAFCEIARIPASHKHILDVRHGPIVLIDKKTLVIALLNKNNQKYQADLINDISRKAGYVITFSGQQTMQNELCLSINYNNDFDPVCYGIPFLNIIQMISYYKALNKNIDPDRPAGLDPWIEI